MSELVVAVRAIDARGILDVAVHTSSHGDVAVDEDTFAGRDISMALLTSRAGLEMGAVIEVDEPGDLIGAEPFDRTILFRCLGKLLNVRTIGLDCGVAPHAGCVGGEGHQLSRIGIDMTGFAVEA